MSTTGVGLLPFRQSTIRVIRLETVCAYRCPHNCAERSADFKAIIVGYMAVAMGYTNANGGFPWVELILRSW